jgi:hypothetical protein
MRLIGAFTGADEPHGGTVRVHQPPDAAGWQMAALPLASPKPDVNANHESGNDTTKVENEATREGRDVLFSFGFA